ncbi:hypothetical protein FB451DRAFT_1554853 [Mycena latifolia]|nr:hypothetical protein FB451DRAFT_1554853 [Mycena latifolia]
MSSTSLTHLATSRLAITPDGAPPNGLQRYRRHGFTYQLEVLRIALVPAPWRLRQAGFGTADEDVPALLLVWELCGTSGLGKHCNAPSFPPQLWQFQWLAQRQVVPSPPPHRTLTATTTAPGIKSKSSNMQIRSSARMGDRRRGIHGLRRGAQVLQCIRVPAGQPYWQVFLTQAVGLGIGLGFTFLPALGAVEHPFARRCGLAIGLMTNGISIGGIVFPLVLKRLLFKRAFVIGLRATAGLVTGLLLLADLLMHALPADARPAYMVFVLAGLVIILGLFYPAYYLQLTRGIRAQFASDTVSVLNAGGVIGLLLPPLLIDRVGSFADLIPMMLLASTCVLCMLAPAAAGQGVVTIVLVYGALNAAYRNEVGLRMGVYITHLAMTPRATPSAPLHLWH